MNKNVALIALGLVVSFPFFARADDVIYDNGRPPRYFHGFEMTQWIEADDFRVSADATLTGVFFYDLEDPQALGYQGEIDWILYADALGQPGTVLASGAAVGDQVTRILLHRNANGIYDHYSNSFQISPGVNLIAGTTYWLGLHNGPLTFTTRAEFYWQTTKRNKTSATHNDEAPFCDDEWARISNQQQSFYLSGTTGLQ